MSFKTLQMKRHFVVDKILVGIDPAKIKHQAAVLNKNGIQVGHSFVFKKTYSGYTEELWNKLRQILLQFNSKDVVFAIETSCNLWQTLASYLYKKGFFVLLVSPLSTKHSRPIMNHDFSRTDPKDALLIANNARDGYFDFYKEFNDHINAMHNLSIAYHKLRKELVCNRQRLRAFMDLVFPEFLNIIKPDTQTALYLLKKYFLPQDFINMDIKKEALIIKKISISQYGLESLSELQQAAHQSIGIPVQNENIESQRLILNTWIILIENLEKQLDIILEKLISLAKQTPYFSILSSFKGHGIADTLIALFIAETRDLSAYTHYKKLEKLAGYNLKRNQSGQYIGPRKMSHIGNKRLSWILYKMTEGGTRYIPEIRLKYLRRQLTSKSIVACCSILLKLIVALVKENRPYQLRQDKIKELEKLEKKYQEFKNQKKNKRTAA
jgi:transposase